MISAATLTTFLTPFLPYLVNTGVEIAKTAGKQFSNKLSSELADRAWEKAKSIWAILKPKVESDPVSNAAVNAIALAKDNTEVEAARKLLEVTLAKLLTNDKVLQNEIERLLKNNAEEVEKVINAYNVTINSTGDNNINIGFTSEATFSSSDSN